MPYAALAAVSPVRRRLRWAALGALGVVYGDLGTSPLYTLQTVVQATSGRFTPESALGILSLIVWTLIIIVSIKYCVFVMRAHNHGEGGILALMSLIGANNFGDGKRLLTFMGLLGAALLYGDGVITPAISVLSALEGVNAVTAGLRPYVMPIAVVILIALFTAQKFGTERIGRAFGPIMLTWFIVIAGLGVTGIVRNPSVLAAVDPRHAVGFLRNSGSGGFLVLGGVFLCVTGAEALYADMGHFGRRPIKLSWYTIVLPALLLNYAGQTALLIGKGTIGGNPFFQLAPRWGVYPLVMLATLATIIASQAIITGSFSMTRQAMQLGWLPGVNIRQTSDRVYGQIYVPAVNWLMMTATVAIAVAFQSSDRLAGAYGTAVSTTMLLTTCLLYTVMRKVWHWAPVPAFVTAGIFLVVDASFFCANLLKIADGGWLPLSIGAIVYLIMFTWRSGIHSVHMSLLQRPDASKRFLAELSENRIARVPGTSVFLTRTTLQVPYMLIDYVNHTRALHRSVITLTVVFEDTPRVSADARCSVKKIAEGMWHIAVRFGFIEIPNLCEALYEIPNLDPSIDLASAVYFGARDQVVNKTERSLMPGWRVPLFAFLHRNAVKTVDRFHLPSQSVVEIGRQIEV